MDKDLTQLATEAKIAITSLKELRKQFMAGQIKYEDIQNFGKPLVVRFNQYTKALAKERKMPYKPITLGYFLR